MIKHEKWDGSRTGFGHPDLALIKLASIVRFRNSLPGPACLPPSGPHQWLYDSKVYVAGKAYTKSML